MYNFNTNNTWRLIIDPPSCGSWNMALDEALMDSAKLPGSLPALRLYSWNPACLSLGHAQSFSEVDKHALTQQGWDLVRRPTGGRAILHIDELTYSITASADHPMMRGGILESYRRISQAFLHFLQSLSLNPVSSESSNTNSKDPLPVCFEVPSNYEITINGKKIIGSAQARRNNTVLQHGTIPLVGDISRITDVLIFRDEQERSTSAERVLSRATTIETEAGRIITREEAVKNLVQAFEQVHQIEFVLGSLTGDEMKNARDIQQNKYASSNWTDRI